MQTYLKWTAIVCLMFIAFCVLDISIRIFERARIRPFNVMWTEWKTKRNQRKKNNFLSMQAKTSI